MIDLDRRAGRLGALRGQHARNKRYRGGRAGESARHARCNDQQAALAPIQLFVGHAIIPRPGKAAILHKGVGTFKVKRQKSSLDQGVAAPARRTQVPVVFCYDAWHGEPELGAVHPSAGSRCVG